MAWSLCFWCSTSREGERPLSKAAIPFSKKVSATGKSVLVNLLLAARIALWQALNQMFSQDVPFLFQGESKSPSLHFGFYE